jgi:hypothetical protein
MHLCFPVFDDILIGSNNIGFLRGYFPISKFAYNGLGVTLKRFYVISSFKEIVSLRLPEPSSVLLIIPFLIFTVLFIKACLFVVELAAGVAIMCLDVVLLLIIVGIHSSIEIRIVYKIYNTIICWSGSRELTQMEPIWFFIL